MISPRTGANKVGYAYERFPKTSDCKRYRHAQRGALDAQEQPMKIGVIGLGNRGHNAHVFTLKQLSDAKITAICDIQPDLMEEINDELPSKAATYVDYRD